MYYMYQKQFFHFKLSQNPIQDYDEINTCISITWDYNQQQEFCVNQIFGLISRGFIFGEGKLWRESSM